MTKHGENPHSSTYARTFLAIRGEHDVIHEFSQWMSKRRRTSSGKTRYQVPSLKSLALEAVRRHAHNQFGQHNIPRATRRRFDMSDSNMSESVSTGTQAGTSSAKQGANEVGKGLQVTIPRAIPHGYNNNYTVRLTYADSFNVALTNAGGGEEWAFRTNSIYDPDYTGNGHQPLMRDLWASQYDYYTVLACHYHIELYNCAVDTITATATGSFAQRVGAITANLLPSTNLTDIANVGGGYPYPSSEMKNVQTKVIWPENWVTFEGTLTPGDFIVDAKDADDDTTWTAVGSNPAVPRYLGIGLNAFNSSTFSGQNKAVYSNIQIFVKLQYDVQFTQLNQSLRSTAS